MALAPETLQTHKAETKRATCAGQCLPASWSHLPAWLEKHTRAPTRQLLEWAADARPSNLPLSRAQGVWIDGGGGGEETAPRFLTVNAADVLLLTSRSFFWMFWKGTDWRVVCVETDRVDWTRPNRDASRRFGRPLFGCVLVLPSLQFL
jgi:hypothetical protein